MRKSVKIAISMPAEVLEAVETRRAASGETRSEFFRRAVEARMRRENEREADERYVKSYRDHPEDPAELEALFRLGLEAWAEEPWDEEG
ncbi:MAG: ribbon-helix-helix protein, CopG family [Chloroflexi bacterium]|nr:ribbon-helix-helix protein, CopG family [Chloroflexota bacterium]